jgi:AcrR family transcriptional regulator
MSILKSMENEKYLRIIEAAKTVFLRYGFRRVTMQDVAAEAGISRPALYLIFANKEEIFKAAVEQISGESLIAIRAGLGSHLSIEAKLNFTFELWTVRPFELMLSSPDAGDLVDCTHGFARETMQRIGVEFEALLVEILQPLAPSGQTSVLPIAQVAQLMAASIHGYKEAAGTVAELRVMIAGLIKLTLAALNS